jgi:hypothetical protein
VTLVRRDRVLELLELDVRAVVGVDRELQLRVDRLDVREHRLSVCACGLDLVRCRKAGRRRRGQGGQNCRSERSGEAPGPRPHAAVSRRTTLVHSNCPHNVVENSNAVISGQMRTCISVQNRRDLARHNPRARRLRV